jgi:hypothetical protein
VPTSLLSALIWALSLVPAWPGQCVLGEPVGVVFPPVVATFPVRVAVAGEEENDEWLARELDAARAFFAPFGVQFARAGEVDALPERFAHIETRQDRDALAARVQAHVINVFVVDSLRDVDDPQEMRRGVHWHGPGGTHYIILIATASPQVLAHELGHFFGNPHSKVVDNLMSYERSGGWVFFDADQGRRIVARAREYLQSGELSPVPSR